MRIVREPADFLEGPRPGSRYAGMRHRCPGRSSRPPTDAPSMVRESALSCELSGGTRNMFRTLQGVSGGLLKPWIHPPLQGQRGSPGESRRAFSGAGGLGKAVSLGPVSLPPRVGRSAVVRCTGACRSRTSSVSYRYFGARRGDGSAAETRRASHDRAWRGRDGSELREDVANGMGGTRAVG
jgi:hypothetical protein